MGKADQILQGFPSERSPDIEHPRVQKLFAEWGQDHAMARERNETGKEPPVRPLETKRMPVRSKSEAKPQRPSKAIDVPF